ncbi:MAG: 50S ribosomal protein L4 [Acidimicrobiales bacterium]
MPVETRNETVDEAAAEVPAATSVTVARHNGDGKVIDRVTLDEAIFGVEPNVPLMHQVVTAQLAARRAGTQSTRTRSEVRGGGAKPYRQKGTGRARQGTVRAPQFTGGGVALGPKPRSYAQRTPRKMIQGALFSALSDRVQTNRLLILDEFPFSLPKTKDAVKLLDVLGIDGAVLVVLGPDDAVAERSFSNLPQVDLVEASQLTCYEILANDWLLIASASVPGGVSVVPGSEVDLSAEDDDADVEDVPADDETGADQSDETVEAGDETAETDETAAAYDEARDETDETAADETPADETPAEVDDLAAEDTEEDEAGE